MCSVHLLCQLTALVSWFFSSAPFFCSFECATVLVSIIVAVVAVLLTLARAAFVCQQISLFAPFNSPSVPLPRFLFMALNDRGKYLCYPLGYLFVTFDRVLLSFHRYVPMDGTRIGRGGEEGMLAVAIDERSYGPPSDRGHTRISYNKTKEWT